MKKKKFTAALNELQEDYSKDNVSRNVYEIKLLVLDNHLKEAIAACNELKKRIEMKEFGDNIEGKELGLCSDLHFLIAQFTCTSYETALLLLRCQFMVIKTLLSDVSKQQDELTNLGLRMKTIVKKLVVEKKEDIIKQQFVIMDEILSEIQNLRDENIQRKCRNLLKFLSCFTECCVLLLEIAKAIELIKKAIFFLKLLFGGKLKIDVYPLEVRAFGGNNSEEKVPSGENYWIFYTGSEDLKEITSKLEAN